jgi:hypothetical protein
VPSEAIAVNGFTAVDGISGAMALLLLAAPLSLWVIGSAMYNAS